MKSLEHFFTFRGNIGRVEFLINIFISFILFIFPSFIMLLSKPESEALLNVFFAFMIIVRIVSIYIFICSIVRRLRDTNMKFRWLLLLLIPWINILFVITLLIYPGWGNKTGDSHMLALLKHVAESDSPVNYKETAIFESFCNTCIDKSKHKVVRDQFVNGVNNPLLNFNYHLNRYAKINNLENHHRVIEILHEIANAETPASNKQTNLLNQASNKLYIQ